MNSTLKNIFVNPELDYLRSGWRIGIFFLITAMCTTVITEPVVKLLKMIPGLPMEVAGTFIFYLTTTLAVWLVLRFVDKRPFKSIGVTFASGWGKQLFQGFLFGSGMLTVIFVIEYSTGMVVIEFRGVNMVEGSIIFLNSILLYTFVGYGEEFLFRGYFYQTFIEGSSSLIATLTISLVFALAHSQNPNVSLFGLINVGLAGIWFSIAYLKTKALWLPIGLHISWNFFQGFVYSYPVSGTTSERVQIGTAIVNGPEWLTGGTFGPEGGALATLMLIIGTFLIYRWDWVSASGNAWSVEQWREERKQQIALRMPEPVQTNQ
ncbi:MAG: type II CAAX endopeptidase family protein [Bacteroidota bacterium]